MNNKNKFKYIKGKCGEGEPADIYFFSDVDSWSADEFKYEFRYLVDYVGPSVINVHINSSGGNCVGGVGIFSMINDCKIPTVTINDGVAASMGSVIWAAGKRRCMKDYALLMIHNPFMESGCDDPNAREIVDAFKKQLCSIYQSRFGLDEKTVCEIMDGKEGVDGTWMTCDEAVERGFIKTEDVLKTCDSEKEKLCASLRGISSYRDLAKASSRISDLMCGMEEMSNKNNNQHLQNKKTMNEEMRMIAAILGISGDAATNDKVVSEVNTLVSLKNKYSAVEGELSKAKSEVSDLKTKLAGSEASVQSLTQQLSEANASLSVYKADEEKKKNADIEAMVDAAIAMSKINKDSKASWIEMAKSNYELTKQTLDSIPGRDVISQHLNGESEEPKTPLEHEIEEKVKAVIGKDFKFREPNF